jgi:ATP/maltotriose-dependent transcriptional regulator MalT
VRVLTSFYQLDFLGSTTSLSNSAGALANTYTYDSFGELTVSTGTLVNPFQFAGREFDPETGIYNYRFRYTYELAKATAQEIDGKNAIAYVLNGVGDVLTDRGDLTAARKSYEESLEIRKQIGEKQLAAETELALARLSIEEGHAADAESVIRKCQEQFHQDQQADDELAASTTLMDALLAQSKSADAASEVEKDGLLANKSVNEILKLQFDLESARVEIASGRFAPASIQLRSTLRTSRAHHLMGIELETRLAMGILMGILKRRSGQLVSARAELSALEIAARRDGFGLIASKSSFFRNSSD